ncbi:MAG: FAD-binding protein [Bacteroidales bacterium]|nr:FAD-binding protein [Bacteroidales bacterium]
MIKNVKIRVLPQVWRDAEKLEAQLCREYDIPRKALCGLRMKHTSIDARQRQVMVQLDVDLYINEEPPQETYRVVEYREVPANAPQAIVVGAGPGGLFAALRLIELGVRPIVIERGRNVRDRRRDVALITREQRVDPNSNYCFGEGGAGAFSDGKLFTRSKKRGNVQGVLEGLCQFGADTGILDASHPHIGTEKLPAIIASIREKIISCGGQIHFETVVSRLILSANKVVGVCTLDGREFLGPVILATGHSARDIYRMLHDEGILIEAKGLAIGCRLEHPQPLIDRIQYHSREGRGEYLPPAEYSFVTQVDNRGVYSFCMCPGGVIVPSATMSDQVVVNGMSTSSRGGRWANAAMVTEIRVDDIPLLASQLHLDIDPASPLTMMAIQEAIEHQCWLNGGRTQVAPAQRMTDFVNGRLSANLPASSYTPGIVASPLHFWLPKFIGARLQEGLRFFGRRAHGFLTDEALLVGTETRTSSPVRIPRDSVSLCHTIVQCLYPCGEGAGYAGGIVSSAMDGRRCADALVAQCF